MSSAAVPIDPGPADRLRRTKTLPVFPQGRAGKCKIGLLPGRPTLAF